jgi:hypothetical protein
VVNLTLEQKRQEQIAVSLFKAIIYRPIIIETKHVLAQTNGLGLSAYSPICLYSNNFFSLLIKGFETPPHSLDLNFSDIFTTRVLSARMEPIVDTSYWTSFYKALLLVESILNMATE